VNREIVFPPIKLFLQVVFSDKYQFINEEDPYKRDEGGNYILHNGNKIFNKEHMCNSLYNDIGMIWQAGLFEIRQNKEYLYTYTLTDDILSYLLTLRLKTLLEDIDDGNNNNNENYEDEDEDEDENFNEVIARAEPQTISAFYRAQIIKSTLGDELTFFDSTQNTRLTVGSKTIRDKIKAFNKTITIGTTAANNISISTTILFVLTLLENIMNPTKVSFFLTNDYKNQLYQTKKDWKDKLNGVLDNLFLLLNIGFTENKTKLKLMPLAQQLGGAQTSNKTRKVKRRISRRKTLKQSHH
jgi:hypothetical protein